MDFFETVSKRGSYRREFVNEIIPQEDLEQIIMAGIKAPSGYNHQTTSFIVITNKEFMKKLATIIDTPAMQTASAMIIPLSEYWQAENGLSFEIEDYASAMENVMLAITAKGYAGVWIDGQIKLCDAGERIAAVLNIPEGKHIRAIIPLGKPMHEVTQREKKPLQERVTFIS